MMALNIESRAKAILDRFPTFRRAIIGLRNDARSGQIRRLMHWVIAGHIVRFLRVAFWLRESSPRYLQIGGGQHTIANENWLNGDWVAGDVYLNAANRLPFPDNSLDIVFTEQFVEHLSQPDAQRFLEEAHRILKKGGLLRQSTPDLEKLIGVYMDSNSEVSTADAVSRHMRNHRRHDSYARASSLQFFNDVFRLWGHQYIYDRETFREITEEAGFNEFRWVEFGHSEVDCLCGLERHADEEWMKNGIVMIAEGVKP